MFKKVLIADRGNSALRVLRTCREMGIKTVVPYSRADQGSLPVLFADEAICIGPEPARDSYFNISRLLSAAEVTRCDACHPGYGPLSMDPDFADATQTSGITFIGPDPETLRLLNNRLAVRRSMKKAGVPILPGSEGAINTPQEGIDIALKIGLPVAVRPVIEECYPWISGDYREKNIITKEKDIETKIRMCQAETGITGKMGFGGKSVNGSSEVYLEKFIPNARRIEVQVVAHTPITEPGQEPRTIAFCHCEPRRGVAIPSLVLDEREIILQEKGRGAIAISPPDGLNSKLRQQLQEWAYSALRSVKLYGVASVEFLISPEGVPYFSKINPSLSRYHLLTEIRFGVDLVKEQIMSALPIPPGKTKDYEPATTNQNRLTPLYAKWSAVACALFAENPGADFAPTPGIVTELYLPKSPWIRVDSDLIPGGEVSAYYDLEVGTIAAWAPERKLAILRIRNALRQIKVKGIAINTQFNLHLLSGAHKGKAQPVLE